MNRKQLNSLGFFVDNKLKVVMAMNKYHPENVDEHFVAFGDRIAPHHSLTNLLVAAPMLYQHLTAQYNALDSLQDLVRSSFPKPEAEAMICCLDELKGACKMAQHIAEIGVTDLVEMIEDNKTVN